MTVPVVALMTLSCLALVMALVARKTSRMVAMRDMLAMGDLVTSKGTSFTLCCGFLYRLPLEKSLLSRFLL